MNQGGERERKRVRERTKTRKKQLQFAGLPNYKTRRFNNILLK